MGLIFKDGLSQKTTGASGSEGLLYSEEIMQVFDAISYPIESMNTTYSPGVYRDIIRILLSSNMVTQANSGDDYVLTDAVLPSLVTGDPFITTFVPDSTNTGAVSINVNEYGQKPLVNIDGTDIQPGTLIQGQLYYISYNPTLDSFILSSPMINPSHFTGGFDGGTVTNPIIVGDSNGYALTGIETGFLSIPDLNAGTYLKITIPAFTQTTRVIFDLSVYSEAMQLSGYDVRISFTADSGVAGGIKDISFIGNTVKDGHKPILYNEESGSLLIKLDGTYYSKPVAMIRSLVISNDTYTDWGTGWGLSFTNSITNTSNEFFLTQAIGDITINTDGTDGNLLHQGVLGEDLNSTDVRFIEATITSDGTDYNVLVENINILGTQVQYGYDMNDPKHIFTRTNTGGSWGNWVDAMNVDLSSIIGGPDDYYSTLNKVMLSVSETQDRVGLLPDRATLHYKNGHSTLEAEVAVDENTASSVVNWEYMDNHVIASTFALDDNQLKNRWGIEYTTKSIPFTAEDPNTTMKRYLTTKHANCPDPDNYYVVMTTFGDLSKTYQMAYRISNVGDRFVPKAYYRYYDSGSGLGEWKRVDNGYDLLETTTNFTRDDILIKGDKLYASMLGEDSLGDPEDVVVEIGELTNKQIKRLWVSDTGLQAFVCTNEESGKVYCAGDSGSGLSSALLGLGDVSPITYAREFEIPIIPSDVPLYIEVRNGRAGMIRNGMVYFAGGEKFNNCGLELNSTTNYFNREHSSLTTIISLGLGNSVSVAIKDNGKVYYTGDSGYNGRHIGAGTNITSTVFVEAGFPTDFLVRKVTMAANGIIYLTFDGKIYGAGDNDGRELGLGDVSGIDSYTLIPINGETVQDIELYNNPTFSADSFAIALTTGGNYYVTGRASKFLGYTSATSPAGSTFERVILPGTGKGILRVSTGNAFFLDENGDVYVMGTNEYGELGLGHTNPVSLSFIRHPLSTIRSQSIKPRIVDVQLGKNLTFALLEDGRLFVCGLDTGSAGLGNTVDTTITSFTETFLNRKYFEANEYDTLNI